MTNKELEKRIVNLEKWAATTFDSFHRIDQSQIAQEKSHHNLKVGDKVRQKNKNLIMFDKVGTVCGIKDGEYSVYFQLGEREQTAYFSAEDLELYVEPKHDFKVGDRVQFKSWDEMEKEFGLTESGHIQLPNDWVFNRRMKYFCGSCATIKSISEHGVVELEDITNDRGEKMWQYTFDMLKPVTDEPKCKFKVGDKVIVYKGKKIGIVEFVPTIHDDLYKVGFMDGDCDFFAEEDMTPYTEPRWTFTDDEKVILRNLPEEYKWIARDKDGAVLVSFSKPFKDEDEDIWDIDDYKYGEVRSSYIWQFNHLFQSIKWTDEEPCEFRKYL